MKQYTIFNESLTKIIYETKNKQLALELLQLLTQYEGKKFLIMEVSQ